MTYISTFVSKFHKLFTENTTLLAKRQFLRTNLANDIKSSNKYTRKKMTNLKFSYKYIIVGQFTTLFQFIFITSTNEAGLTKQTITVFYPE